MQSAVNKNYHSFLLFLKTSLWREYVKRNVVRCGEQSRQKSVTLPHSAAEKRMRKRVLKRSVMITLDVIKVKSIE